MPVVEAPGLVERWLRLAAVRVIAERVALSDLDAAIGDGDHGYNLARGMVAVLACLDADEWAGAPPGVVLAGAGRTILGTVGGASGALYGRALQAAAAVAPDILAGLEAAAVAIAGLGRSTSGQKTMLDALLPALAALREAAIAGRSRESALGEAALAAERGALATVPLIAQRGRASYLGERSRGHMDPGAASCALLLRALADAASTPHLRPPESDR